MIKTFYEENIINHLAAIITYGLNSSYSYKSIEEHIVRSPFVNALENNEYNIELKMEKVVETTYDVSFVTKADISIKGLFLAESYVKLFFNYNRSFEYIFLYWPLSWFIERYGIYHEMDFSNLKRDYESKIRKTPLLRKLSKERQIKLTDISARTGINGHTINKYSQDDKFLYGASNNNIYKLAKLFNVKENIFISNLLVYFDCSVYLFDKSFVDYRNCLSLFFVNFFDKRFKETDFKYDSKNRCFRTSEGIKLIVIADSLSEMSITKFKEMSDSKTYLVVIPLGFFGEITWFDCLEKLDAFDVFVLTQEHIYIVKKKHKKEITETINRSLVIRAKEMADSLKR